MKIWLLFLICFLPLILFCQAVIEGKWKATCGISTMSLFKESYTFNVRYISPKFRWSNDDLTEQQEKHAEKYNKTRIMFELMYSPPITNLCTGIHVQHRLIKYKFVSLETYGGIKFFFARGNGFEIKRPFVEGSSNGVWYLTTGLILQLDLGIISPFADIGYDGIFTIGSEFNLRKVYRKTKNRYKLRTIKQNN